MSTTTLAALPPELWEIIWKNCSTSDLTNFSCCSKECCQLVRPLVWRAVKVYWKSLEDLSRVKKKTQHLRHTRRLRFLCSGEPLETNYVSVASNLNYVFENCDVKLVSSVDISFRRAHLKMWRKHAFDSSICECLQSCKQLTRLSFRGVMIPCLGALVGLNNLKQLEVFNCTYTTQDSSRYLVKLPKLNKLTWATYGSHVSRISVPSDIRKLVNVTELHLQGDLNRRQKRLNRIIQSLVNVEVLTLYSTACLYRDDTFRFLPISLKHLCVLYIGATEGSIMRTEWLDDISKIASLRKLAIEGCCFRAGDKIHVLPPYLEELDLCHCSGVNILVHTFAQYPKLQKLSLCYCLDFIQVADLWVSTSLRRLNISKCPKIKSGGLSECMESYRYEDIGVHGLCKWPARITLSKIDKCRKPLYELHTMPYYTMNI